MLKWPIFGVILTGLVFAQSVTVQKPVECADTAVLLQGLAGINYKERPIWWGIEPGATLSKYSLFVNEQTKTWTLIQFDEKIACVLSTGENSTRLFNGPRL